MNSKMNQLFEHQRCVHVLYPYKGMDNYIEQVVSFIEDGIIVGDYTILVENERIFPIIHKELCKRLTEEQLEFVHHVNNFDFYYSSGSYHPPAIAEYFTKMVQPYVENNISFRSWAHVEWASMEDPLHLIEDFEKIVDDAVQEISFPLICAYERERMPNHVQAMLMQTHPYVLLEDDFTISEQYIENK